MRQSSQSRRTQTNAPTSLLTFYTNPHNDNHGQNQGIEAHVKHNEFEAKATRSAILDELSLPKAPIDFWRRGRDIDPDLFQCIVLEVGTTKTFILILTSLYY